MDSLKIEGRMKTALYVAAVTRTYRRAIDDYKTSPDLFEKNLDYYREEIAKCTYRQFTTGFYYGKTDENSQIYDANTYIKEYTYIGIVQDIDAVSYTHLSGHVPEQVKTERSEVLLSMAKRHKTAFEEWYVGRKEKVLDVYKRQL